MKRSSIGISLSPLLDLSQTSFIFCGGFAIVIPLGRQVGAHSVGTQSSGGAAAHSRLQRHRCEVMEGP